VSGDGVATQPVIGPYSRFKQTQLAFGIGLPLPAPAQQTDCAEAAGGEKRTGSNRAELPIPPFWSEARLAIRAASEIRFVTPRQLRIALRELSPIASLYDRSHAALGRWKCVVETNPPRPTRLRRSKRRVRCNRESSWHLADANGPPVQVLVRHHDIFSMG
jgi:hypothetical protein